MTGSSASSLATAFLSVRGLINGYPLIDMVPTNFRMLTSRNHSGRRFSGSSRAVELRRAGEEEAPLSCRPDS